MCQECGCSVVNDIAIDGIKAHTHSHQHTEKITPNYHSNLHLHHKQTLSINQGILAKNEQLAQQNREYFQAKELLVLNILSSPGAGKTALIERMLKDCGSKLRMGVIVGDLATDNDAQRLRSTGAPVVQITTGNACHLEADMVAQAMAKLDLDHLDILIIENVGNLVCPAAYDLGEDLRLVLLSVTEGEDKPIKYPIMFKTAQVVIINKIDLSEAVEFRQEEALANLHKVAPQAKIFTVSARTGQGIDDLYNKLNQLLQNRDPALKNS